MKPRKNASNRTVDIGTIINTVIYAMLIIINVFWDFFSGLFPNITVQMLLTVLIGTLVASEISITFILSKMQRSLSVFHENELITQSDLNTALINSISGRKRIRKLRIYALSTSIINPIVRSALDCEVDVCDLMIRSLNNEEYNKDFSNHVTTVLEMWDDMVTDKKVKTVNKCYFDDLPSEYNIIIDEDMLIIGNYIFTTTDRSHVTIDRVFTINGSRDEGKKVIASYISRFDQSFSYFKQLNGDAIRRKSNASI